MSFKDQLINRTREVKVDLNVDGKMVPVTVRYKSLTVSQLKSQQALFKQRKAKEETLYISELLAMRIVDFTDAEGEVVTVNQELLEGMDLDSLKAIETGIDGDTDPK